MLAAIYLRVSTDEQVLHGVSLSAQEAECSARAIALGATELAVYRDEGLSGSRWDRPGLQALLSALERTDLLVTWDLSRLSRTLEHQSHLLRLLAEHGIRLVCLRQDVELGTAAGRLGVNVLGAVGQFQREQTAENIRSAQAAIAASGRMPGCRMFGYRRDEAGALQPDPVQGRIVGDLFTRLAAGESLLSLARWLGDLDMPSTPRTQSWHHTRLKYLLSNPLYVGKFRWGGVIFEGTHEPLIDQDTWDAAQRVLALRGRSRGRSVRSWAPLFSCGLCGARCCIITRTRPSRTEGRVRMRSIQCAVRHHDRRVHQGLGVGERCAEAMVWRHLELLLGDEIPAGAISSARAALTAVAFPPSSRRDATCRVRARQRGEDAGAKLLQRPPAGGDAPPGLDDIHARLSDLARLRRDHAQALRDGGLTVDDLVALNAPLVQEEDDLRAQLRADDLLEPSLARLGELLVSGPAVVLANLRALPAEEQVAFLRDLFPRIEIMPHMDLYAPRCLPSRSDHRRVGSAVGPGFLVFHHLADLVPPVSRPIPVYFSERRGVTGLAF